MKTGSLVGNKYRLTRQIGEGAMGVVWAAVNELTSREVALKLILRSTEDLRIRLMREAQACGKLSHRNIIEVLDVGQTDTGDPFLVMPLLSGETLADLLERQRRVEPSVAAQIGRDVARALAAAHAASIIHRDLKPANIFLHQEPGSEGTVVKVLDFGVAKNLSAVDAIATIVGGAVGSPAYMSPEQIRVDRDLDQRTDLWSLGVVLFEMLTGTRPFQGDTAEVIQSVLAGEIPRVSKVLWRVDPGLDDLVTRCLERTRDRRIATAAELASLLNRYVAPNETSRVYAALPLQPSTPAPAAATSPTASPQPAPFGGSTIPISPPSTRAQDFGVESRPTQTGGLQAPPSSVSSYGSMGSRAGGLGELDGSDASTVPLRGPMRDNPRQRYAPPPPPASPQDSVSAPRSQGFPPSYSSGYGGRDSTSSGNPQGGQPPIDTRVSSTEPLGMSSSGWRPSGDSRQSQMPLQTGSDGMLRTHSGTLLIDRSKVEGPRIGGDTIKMPPDMLTASSSLQQPSDSSSTSSTAAIVRGEDRSWEPGKSEPSQISQKSAGKEGSSARRRLLLMIGIGAASVSALGVVLGIVLLSGSGKEDEKVEVAAESTLSAAAVAAKLSTTSPPPPPLPSSEAIPSAVVMETPATPPPTKPATKPKASLNPTTPVKAPGPPTLKSPATPKPSSTSPTPVPPRTPAPTPLKPCPNKIIKTNCR